MSRNRCSKIISLVTTTSSSHELQLDTNNEQLTLSTINENYFLNDTDNMSLSDLNFDSDDSLFDKDYVPSSLDSTKEDSDSSTNTIPNSQPNTVTIPESPEISNDEDTPQNLTKKGQIRKRKKYDESMTQRKEMKKLKVILMCVKKMSHPIYRRSTKKTK